MAHIARRAETVISELLAEISGILIVGPRATGKTTSAGLFAHTIVRLDRPAEAAAFVADPDVALAGLREPVLLDEWQEVPPVLAAVKRAIDSDPRPGRFILTGSVRGDVDQAMWPATGRLVRVQMHGITYSEQIGVAAGPTLLDRLTEGHEPVGAAESFDLRGYVELALRGGFPELVTRLHSERARRAWLASYVDQVVTRDAGALEERDPARLRRYLEAVALNTAGVVSDTTLWNAARIDRRTALAYERLLGSLLMVNVVPAWQSNRLKRLARAPKRYLVDPALLVGVLGVDAAAVMRDGDLLGRVLDTFVGAQLRADASLAYPEVRLHHVRDDRGAHEIDIVAEVGAGRVIAIEVKATASPTASDARHLKWLSEKLGDSLLAGVVFHTGPRSFRLGDRLWAAPISALWGSGKPASASPAASGTEDGEAK